MLRTVGLNAPEELFSSIPADILLRAPLNTPAALSEPELLSYFESLAAKNAAARRSSFLGAGAYAHYAPTVIDALIQRSEFFTAYTPYQPEVSQGTLQAIFEFQTLVCQLTGMEVANASMYDGSTAVAEAVLMAERVTRRSRVIVSPALHPEYLHVAQTYVSHAGVELEQAGFDEQTGLTNFDSAAQLDEKTAAVVVQSPNFFGCVEDLQALAERAHKVGALLVVVVTESMSLGLLRSPGACGADIVVAKQSGQKAAYAARQLAALVGFALPYSAPRFNEFVVRAPVAAEELLRRLAAEHNITGGLALARYFPERTNDLLVCVTETNTRAEIDALVAGLKASNV